MMRRPRLPLFCCLMVMAILLSPLGSVAEAKNSDLLVLKPGTPSVWTEWRALPAGDLKISIHNKGTGSIYFYVFVHCDHLQCPTLVSGEVKAREHLLIELPHPAGIYMLKMDNDEQQSSWAIARWSQ